MKRQDFEKAIIRYRSHIKEMRDKAHRAHHLVNHHYDGSLPYGHHLDMVANEVMRYGHEVVVNEEDIPSLLFGAYFHDAIEDARLSYNDLLSVAREFMPENMAKAGVEIAYALTNEKGRTRAERAGTKYYEGIRSTPFAPFVKIADRLANAKYCASHPDKSASSRMMCVYAGELSHFLDSLRPEENYDCRFGLPDEMVKSLQGLLTPHPNSLNKTN